MSGYSSPPCYASEVAPDYFGPIAVTTRGELLAWLYCLLTDERTATSAATMFSGDHQPDGAVWKQMAALQRCGMKNCATLTELIRCLDGNLPAASVAGDAPGLEGANAQLKWLIRDQRRLAGSIHDVLPNVEHDLVRHALAEIEDAHLFNIEACEALVEVL